jgi:hypothetical protein
MASLQYDRENTTPRQDHFCGGTLISPYYVMTAAQCAVVIGEGPDQFVPLEDLRVVVGGATLNGDDGRVRRISRPSQVRIHPRYDEQSGNFAHDVAVLRLDRPVTGIKPIRLATTGTDALERPGRLATVTGWGNTIAQPVGPGPGLGLFNGPNRMREAEVPPVKHLWPSRTPIGCLRVLSRLPHNTFRMCPAAQLLLGRSDRGMGRSM